MTAKSRTYRLAIEKLVAGGLGLGHLPDGMVVMVPLAASGEELLVRRTRQRKNYLEATIVEIIQQSDRRIGPPCPLFGRCGGCDFQHMAYGLQLECKGQILAELLSRAQVIDPDSMRRVVRQPLASPKPFGYRQRIRLQTDDKGAVGFYRHRSHHLEPITQCLLACDPINRVLHALQGQGRLSRLAARCAALEIVASPRADRVHLWLDFKQKIKAVDMRTAYDFFEASPLLDAVVFARRDRAGRLVITGETGPKGRKEGPPPRIESVFPRKIIGREMVFSWETGAFSQVNTGQNINCVKMLIDHVAPRAGQRILDLHCGMGNFSLPLAALGAEVVGIDLQRSAIRSAAENAKHLGLARCRFIQARAVEGARQLIRQGERFDCILLDPPRSGCAEEISLLPRFKAGQIISLSCDPATLTRDLKQLVALGYEIEDIRVVDMFPQTHHIETLAVLRRR